jgi:hypothetical protein
METIKVTNGQTTLDVSEALAAKFIHQGWTIV